MKADLHSHRLGVLSPGLCVVLAGAALTASFAPFNFAYAAWVAFVPLLLLWDRNDSLPLIAMQAYSVYLLPVALSYFWPLLNEYPNQGLLGFSGLLFLPLLMAVPFAVSSYVRQRFNRRKGLLVLFAGTILLEYALLFGPWPAPWLPIGHTQAHLDSILQLAEFGGVLGLSSWVWGSNILLFLIVSHHGPIDTRLGFIVVLGVLTLGAMELGNQRMEAFPHQTGRLSVVAVHPNLSEEEWLDPYDDVRVEDMQRLTETALYGQEAPPQLIIWPEMALPVLGQAEHREELYDRLQTWVDLNHTALLTGAATPQGTRGNWDEALDFHHSAMLFRENEQLIRQHHDVLPLRRSSTDSWLETYRVTSNTANDGVRELTLDSIQIGLLVDIEAWIGRYGRRQAGSTEGIITILTRSGWWDNTPGYGPELTAARIRAVELRRSVIQVANSGLSGLVLSDGSVAQTIGYRGAWPLEVPTDNYRSLYARLGEWPAHLSALLLLLVGLHSLNLCYGRRLWARVRRKLIAPAE